VKCRHPLAGIERELRIKIDFSTDDFPSDLSDRARFDLWREMWAQQLGPADLRHDASKPFATTTKMLFLDDVRISRLDTTVGHYVRTRKHVANDSEQMVIGFYRSAEPQIFTVSDREWQLRKGNAVVYNLAQPCKSLTEGVTSWTIATIPRPLLLNLVPHADDQAMLFLDSAHPVVRHLQRTMDFLLDSNDVPESPELSSRTGAAFLDLVALALGARGDTAEVATARGLRAARLREALSIIEARFTEPDLSTEIVANALGLSRRYVNNLLLESGKTFAERVLELRLIKARAMLSDIRNDTMRIGEIAFAVGFGDVSYFNQRFRARFGASPTQYRGR